MHFYSFNDVNIFICDFSAVDEVKYLHDGVDVIDYGEMSWVDMIVVVGLLEGVRIDDGVDKKSACDKQLVWSAIFSCPIRTNEIVDPILDLRNEQMSCKNNDK